MLRKILGPLERGAFRPDRLPADIVTGIALVPPVIAGLALFHLAAAGILLVALIVGVGAHLAAVAGKQPLLMTPVIPALLGVALVGPDASIGWGFAVALAASVLELLRARFLPKARIQTGVLAYVALFLATRGGPAQYVNPGTMRPLAEPIRLWSAYFGGAEAPIDSIRLYVGNVPGPVFATSLLAVANGAAWFWYARRLSPIVLVGFVLGALLPIALFHWNAAFQLDSGPAWFAVALVLADRRLLPASTAARPLMGLAVGLLAMVARTAGVGVEWTFVGVAAIQMVVAVVEGAAWLIAERAGIYSGARSSRIWRGAQVVLPARRRAA